MNRIIMLLLVLTLPLLTGCFNQKATGTQQRWTEIQTATNNLIESLYLSQMAQPDKYANPETVQSDYLFLALSSARELIDACQKFHDALIIQKNVNVDQRLNAIAEKLQDSSKSLLSQLKHGSEILTTAQQISEELSQCQDAQKKQELLQKINNILNDWQSVQNAVKVVLQQIGYHYQELEVLRPILDKEYGFNLPQIKWNR